MLAVTLIPAERDSSTSAGIASSVGCGGPSGTSSRSTPITSRSSSSAAWGGGADDAGGLGHVCRIRVELERARVDGEQRDAVGEDVVHLAGDAQPLRLARPLLAQALL